MHSDRSDMRLSLQEWSPTLAAIHTVAAVGSDLHFETPKRVETRLAGLLLPGRLAVTPAAGWLHRASAA